MKLIISILAIFLVPLTLSVFHEDDDVSSAGRSLVLDEPVEDSSHLVRQQNRLVHP